jgi:hypothetical protein
LQDIKVGDTITIGRAQVGVTNIGKTCLKVMEITPKDKYNVGVHIWDEEEGAFVLNVGGLHGCFWFIFENYQDTIRLVDEPKSRYKETIGSLDFNEKIL